MTKPAVPRRMQLVGQGQATDGKGCGVAFLLHNVNAAELGAGTMRHLVKDGKWNVPVAERPKGWEKWDVRENVR